MARILQALLLSAALAHAALAVDSYLFTSFRKNGETGVFLAMSQDGKTWKPLNGDKPWIKPEHPGMLMRDPFLTRGKDGTWHLLWTWGWTRKETGGGLKIGYSSSKDLVQWTPQREIPIFQSEPTARNAWAPEAAWDEARQEWIVFWSTTIPGRFPDTEKSGDSGYNHRLYAMTTKNWVQFSAPKLWFDPGFNCIDATLVEDGRRWIMVFKDERKTPEQKNLKLAFAASPAGPWNGVTDAFTESWVEGPTVQRIGKDWWIYFDHYRDHHYGAMRTRDWKRFETIPVTFPADHRHGTAVSISDKEAKRLQAETR